MGCLVEKDVGRQNLEKMWSVGLETPRAILPSAFHVPIEGAASFCRAAVNESYVWKRRNSTFIGIEENPLEKIRHGLHENCQRCDHHHDAHKHGYNILSKLQERLSSKDNWKKASSLVNRRLRIEQGKMKLFNIEQDDDYYNEESEYESGLGEFGSMLHKVRTLSKRIRRRGSEESDTSNSSGSSSGSSDGCGSGSETKEKVIDMYEDEFISFTCGHGNQKRRGLRNWLSRLMNRG